MSKKVARSLERRRPFFRPSQWVPRAIAAVDAEHPDLDADGVRRVKRQMREHPTTVTQEAKQLFYWQAWRDMVDGRLPLAESGAGSQNLAEDPG